MQEQYPERCTSELSHTTAGGAFAQPKKNEQTTEIKAAIGVDLIGVYPVMQGHEVLFASVKYFDQNNVKVCEPVET